MNDLEKLFFGELKDLYDGEHRLQEALPELEQEAKLNAVKKRFWRTDAHN
jgi:ferritin-like metal-binding protein YciE